MKTNKNGWALVLSGGGAMGLAHGRVIQTGVGCSCQLRLILY